MQLNPQVVRVSGYNDSELGESGANLVDIGGTLLDLLLPVVMNGQHRLLVDGLDGDKAHFGSCGGFTNGSRIVGIGKIKGLFWNSWAK